MAEKNIGSVVVMDETRFLGIITERDYSRIVVLKGRSSDDTTAADIMSSSFQLLALPIILITARSCYPVTITVICLLWTRISWLVSSLSTMWLLKLF
jgi:CBS domain-containing protein